jgi:hypothetical protein
MDVSGMDNPETHKTKTNKGTTTINTTEKYKYKKHRPHQRKREVNSSAWVLQLHVQSVPITIKVRAPFMTRCKQYNIMS